MIARLAGTLAEKAPDRVVVDVQGVGYAVFVSLQTFAALRRSRFPFRPIRNATRIRARRRPISTI